MAETTRSSVDSSILDYYLAPAPMSDPREYSPRFSELPANPADLVRALQGLVIHVFWAERYGLNLSEARQSEVQLRSVRRKLARLFELDPQPLNEPRPLEKRLVGNCRDFSLLGSAMLRAKGYPARARCGFGTYFIPGHYEDHWMIEIWSADAERWIQMDAQLDGFQQEALKISFNPLDMPPGAFVTGGAAWLLCRQGQANPDDFGIFQWHGWDFIKGNLFRDFLALNKFETLPWDMWSALEPAYEDCTPGQLETLDHLARLTLQGNDAHAAVRALYEENPVYQAPQEWVD